MRLGKRFDFKVEIYTLQFIGFIRTYPHPCFLVLNLRYIIQNK